MVLFVTSLAAPARAGMVEDCNQEYDWDLKIVDCTTAIRSGQWQGKNLTAAYTNRGEAYRNLGDPTRAIENYGQALRLDPGNALVYNSRGNAYDDLGDHARAIEDYDQALRFDPDFTIAYYNRAGAHCALGQVEASFDDRVEALRLGALTAEALQSYLRHHRFYKGAIDGDFGPASRKALRDWTAAGCP